MKRVITGIAMMAFLLFVSLHFHAATPAAESHGEDVTTLRELKLPPVERKPWVFKGFPIMAWWPPPGTKTLADFKRYEEAGFTIYVANPDAGFEKETADTIDLTFAPNIKDVEPISWLDGTPGKLILRNNKASLRVCGGTGVLLKTSNS